MRLIGGLGVVELDRVGLKEAKAIDVTQLGPQHGAQVSIALEGPQLGTARQQVAGEGSQSGADLHDAAPRFGLGRADDVGVDAPVVQEVLAPALAGREPMLAQEFAGAGDGREIDAHRAVPTDSTRMDSWSSGRFAYRSMLGARPASMRAQAAAAIIAALSPQ